MKQKVKLGDLVIDSKLTNLRGINGFFVSQYRQAYRMGKDLGTILVEKGTNRIVSGNHRVTAMLGEFGPEKIIVVEAITFATELDLLSKFAEENIRHGMPLDGKSKTAIILEMTKEGATPEQLATLFCVPVKSIIKRGENVVTVMIGNDKAAKPVIMPVKRCMPTGITITEEAYQEHRVKDRGVSIRSLADQITRHLQGGYIDTENDAVMESLKTLYVELNTFFQDRVEKAA